MRQRANWGRYLALLIIVAAAVVYQAGITADVVRDWSGGVELYRLPIQFQDGTRVIRGLGERAEAAGLQAGDEVLTINGAPMRGYAQATRLPAGPARLTILRRDAAQQPLQLDLRVDTVWNQLPFTAAEERLLRLILLVLMPWLCLFLGAWACAIRPRDPQAWLLLALMLTFPHLMNPDLQQFSDGIRQFAILYHSLMLTLLAVTMPLFGIYFAERFVLDLRFPWVKWLVILPALVSGISVALRSVLLSDHLDLAPGLVRAMRYPADFFGMALFVSIGLFFFSLGWKMGLSRQPDARRRLKMLLVGTCVAMSPMFLLILASVFTRRPVLQLLPTWGLTLALLMLFLFPLTVTYVIVVHRALDVRVALRQGIQYTLAQGGARVLMGLVILGVVVFVSFALDEHTSRAQRLRIIAQGLLVVLLLQRLRKRVADWIDRKFFRQAYDAERILSELSDQVRTMVDAKSLLRTVGDRISQSLFVPRLSFLLADGQHYRTAYAVGFDNPPEVSFSAEAATVKQLKAAGEPARVYFDDDQSWVYQNPGMTGEERDNLRRLETQLILPLAVKEKLLGFISLGQKKSEEPYSGSDLRLLRSLALQTGLALENSRLTAAVAAEAAQRERINRELEIAREVQERLFPQNTPAVDGLDCAGGCRPALGVGGDYYDFLQLPGDRLGIVIGDVAGKGIAAALLMASLQASVRGQTIYGAQSLAAMIGHVNTLIYESSTSNRYATLFYGQLDTRTLRLDYVNAGHNPPMLVRAGGSLEELKAGGTVVGLLPRFPYEQGSVQLEPGDLLVAFTDGISEAQNSAGQEWGEDRLLMAIQAAGRMPAGEMIDYLIREADAFAAGAPQHDDMTLLIIRVLPAPR